MIDYDTGTWGLSFIFQCKGSVFPKSMLWAVVSTSVGVLLHLYFKHTGMVSSFDDSGIKTGITCYNIAVSFVLVFRTQQAYARWWEGGSLLQAMRGEWLNAYSSLLAFSSRDASRKADKDRFQHQLVRFVSLLHGAALRQISTAADANFEIIDLSGVDREHLAFLDQCAGGTEVTVILQWVQQIIVDAMNDGILCVPPPILSRAFQELSKGMVNFASAQKISELPFPFPYAQMITTTLVVHTFLLPVLMAILCTDTWWVGILSAVPILSFWSINYVAQEIESPFGDDANDLPLQEMQVNFNRNLATLMMRATQSAPTFRFSKEMHRSFKMKNISSNHVIMSDDMCSDDLSGQSRAPSDPELAPERILGRQDSSRVATSTDLSGMGQLTRQSGAGQEMSREKSVDPGSSALRHRASRRRASIFAAGGLLAQGEARGSRSTSPSVVQQRCSEALLPQREVALPEDMVAGTTSSEGFAMEEHRGYAADGISSKSANDHSEGDLLPPGEHKCELVGS
eukprot:CAMPEP_0179353062 /NCGR_PEP_ID=MMETSP0797-20121207/76128_1 /TAXON_ID=47934 /ORGANISM="Dinophysis acuminata, Strain DAEP01" /LENGTH=512 /DNA_ID=CAMNT_0021068095 /DNA_START=24 /DNA_END=1558 /DNA_ORIENTATION=-